MQTDMKFKDDHEILSDNFTHCKHRLSNLAKNYLKKV